MPLYYPSIYNIYIYTYKYIWFIRFTKTIFFYIFVYIQSAAFSKFDLLRVATDKAYIYSCVARMFVWNDQVIYWVACAYNTYYQHQHTVTVCGKIVVGHLLRRLYIYMTILRVSERERTGGGTYVYIIVYYRCYTLYRLWIYKRVQMYIDSNIYDCYSQREMLTFTLPFLPVYYTRICVI